MTSRGHGSTMQPPYDAVIFDMDGGVTGPASVDGAAWKLLFDEALADPRALADGPPLPFDAVEDYQGRHGDRIDRMPLRGRSSPWRRRRRGP